MPKFFAKIPFAAGATLYAMHTKEPYEHDDADLIQAWENAGYVSIVPESANFEDGQDAPPADVIEPFGTEDAPTEPMPDEFEALTVEQLEKKYTKEQLIAEIERREIDADTTGKTKKELIAIIKGA